MTTRIANGAAAAADDAQRGAALADDIVASVVSSELLQRVMERLTPATT